MEVGTSTAMDLWTNDQETVLLKAIMKWKPVGMHKHFRMLAIQEYLLSEGVISPANQHITIGSIWRKLGSLYDLSTLDEREDSIINGLNDDEEDDAEQYDEFILPSDEYGERMFERRLKPEGTDDPPAMQFSRPESTIADSDEPRSSPASARGSGRNARASARRGKASRLHNEVGNSRRTSKATSTADDTANEGTDGSLRSEEEQTEQEERGRGGNKRARGHGQKPQPTRNAAKRVRRR